MPSQSRDISVLLGGNSQGDMIFGHGPVAGLASFDGVEASLLDAELCECFEAGIVVHVVGKDKCCQLYQATFEVVGVSGCVLSLALKCGQLPEGVVTEGYITQAADLSGFNLYGAAYSNAPGSRGDGLKGCMAKDGNQLVLIGRVLASVGDSVDFPAAGITGATVLGISQVTNGATVTHTVLTLDAFAAIAVACSAPKPATVRAACLAEFEFEINAECGRATYRLNSAFSVEQSACCGGCVAVGCYEISLVSGAVPPSNYPPGNYIAWAQVVAGGQLYAQQSLSLVSK